MAFVVEDGSGISNANAYVAKAFVDTYHLDRGNTKWTGADALKEQCIIRATDYVDKRFGPIFLGRKLQKDQNLEWPRLGAYDPDGYAYTGLDLIPRKLQQAISEYALRALLLGELAPDAPANVPTQSQTLGSENGTETAGRIIGQRDVAGPVESETTMEGSWSRVSRERDAISGLISTSNIPEYPAADLLIRELVKSGTSRRLIRG